mgnify:CR=1 FL=1
MPNLIAVSCHRCQARIDVPPDSTLTTCAQCGTRLAVVRSDTALWTEPLADDEPTPSSPPFATREELGALTRRVALNEAESEALARASLALGGAAARLTFRPTHGPSAGSGDAAGSGQWVDTGRARGCTLVLTLPWILFFGGIGAKTTLSLVASRHFVLAVLCLGVTAVLVAPAAIGYRMNMRRLDAYDAERAAYERRRDAILAAPGQPEVRDDQAAPSA